jgi:uncharacterized protein (TIGR03437 family)
LMGILIPNPKPPPPPPINQFQFSGVQSVFMLPSGPAVVEARNNRILLFDPFEQWPADGTSPPAKATTGPIGQTGYTNGKPNRGQPEPGPNTLSQPTFAVASSSELFVVDSGNNRLLVFPLAGLGQNASATRVLGQDDFPFRSANLIEGREMNFYQGSGSGDGGLVIDLVSSVPHLYIADTYNNRVLGYLDARKVRPGDKADLVIGQPDFQRSLVNYPSNDPAKPNAQSLFLPAGLALDANGNLYVADLGNGRVVRFPAPFDQPNPIYPSADLVIGQSSFGAQVTDPTDRTMRQPYGLAFTSDGGLLVSDAGLNRVLFFPGPTANFKNGMPAAKVFGQADFNSSAPGADTNQMSVPRHIATDSDDRLYVVDEQNGRVMIFDQVPFIGNNARAGTILTGPTPGSNFNFPRGIFVSKLTGEIWITEANAGRLTRFPRFDNLIGAQNQSDFGITSNFAVAVTEDAFGDLYVAEGTNRVAIYYPGFKTAVNAANYLSGRALAPGTIVYVEGQGAPFTDTNTDADPSGWPTVLADTQVLINNNPAPINHVYPDQLSFVMPMNAPTSGTVEMQVVRQSTGQILGVGPVDMAPASPALFTLNSNGTGQLLATNDDGMQNQPGHPISRGHVISLFGTGPGVISNAPPDGQPPSDKVSTDNMPDVWIEPAFVNPANIMYSGLAPGMIGVWQIDFKIPDSTVPGNTVQVFVRVKSIASSQAPQKTTIAVTQ